MEKTKKNYLTLTVYLERQGQTYFYMAFLISLVVYYMILSTNLILVSILTEWRSVISNTPKLVT